MKYAWLLLLAIVSWPGVAQEDQNELDEEITVTARKQKEALKDTPLAVTVLSGEDLEKAHAETVADAFSQVPSVTILDLQYPGFITMTSRGISQVTGGDAPMAVLIDGVTMAHPNGINQALLDVERMEFIKGPQGALHGRNAIGGTLSVVTRQPSSKPFQSVRLGAGNVDYKTLDVVSSGPLNEQWFYQVSGVYRDREGYHHNPIRNEKIDPYEDRTLALKLRFVPDQSTQVQFKLGAADTENGGAPFIALFPQGLANSTDIPADHNEPTAAERNIRDASLKVETHLGAGWVLSAMSSYLDLDENYYGDLDFTRVRISAYDRTDDIRSFNQEFRVSRSGRGPTNWVAGVFFQNTKSDSDILVDLNLDGDQSFETHLALVEGKRNRDTSAYVQMIHRTGGDWEWSLATRYDRARRESRDAAGINWLEKTDDRLQSSITATRFLGQVGMLYGSLAQGFRAGGFNAARSNLFDKTFAEETADSAEIGYKTGDLWTHISLELAVFYTDFQNQQIFVHDVETLGVGLLNIAESTIMGGEIDLRAQLGKGLWLRTAFGLTDTQIDRFDNTQLPFDLNVETLEGNHTPNADRYSLNLALNHQHTIDRNRSISVGINYERRGKRYWHVENIDYREPLDLIGADFALRWHSWTLRIGGKNLGNQRYTESFTAREHSGNPMDLSFPAQLRRYTVTFGKRF